MRAQLLKRLQSLWVLELLNAVVIFPAFVWAWSGLIPTGLLTILSTAVVCVILLVGAGFWRLKYQDVKHGTARLPQFRAFFRAMKFVIIGLMAGLLVVLAARPGRFWTGDTVFGGAMGLFALAEFVNYYYWQLMYDNRADWRTLRQHRRLKRGIMRRELGV